MAKFIKKYGLWVLLPFICVTVCSCSGDEASKLEELFIGNWVLEDTQISLGEIETSVFFAPNWINLRADGKCTYDHKGETVDGQYYYTDTDVTVVLEPLNCDYKDVNEITKIYVFQVKTLTKNSMILSLGSPDLFEISNIYKKK